MARLHDIKLCYHSSDPDEIARVNRYWKMDEEDRFVYEAGSVALSKCDRNQVATAYDRAVRHPDCGHFRVVGSRSEVRGTKRAYGSCDACREADLCAAAKQKGHEQSDLLAAVSKLVASDSVETVDYDELPYDLIFLIAALNNAMGGSLQMGQTVPSTLPNLCPLDGGEYEIYNKLYQAHAISPLPADGKTRGFLLREGKLSWYFSQVGVFVKPHVSGSYQDAMSVVEHRLAMVDDVDRLISLWQTIALQECRAYLEEQMNLHDLPWPDQEQSDQILSLMQAAFLEFSPAQMWCVLWRCVKDIAAMTSMQYYNKPKAVGTLKGKIERQISRARKNEIELQHYDRTRSRGESEVAALFRQVFGITERTSLPRAKTAFEDRARAAWRDEQDIREEHWQLVNEMIEAAIENGSLTDTVINFGRMMQDGLPLEKAAERLSGERAAAD